MYHAKWENKWYNMWWLRKTNETTHFKVKILGGTIPREQFTISNWDLQSGIPIRNKPHRSHRSNFQDLKNVY